MVTLDKAYGLKEDDEHIIDMPHVLGVHVAYIRRLDCRTDRGVLWLRDVRSG